MSGDRSPNKNSGTSSGRGGRGPKPGSSTGRSGKSGGASSGGRSGGRSGGGRRTTGGSGNRSSKPGGKPAGRSGSRGGGGRGGGGRGGAAGRSTRRDDTRRQRPEPRTEAERRAAEVRAKRGPRAPVDPDAERIKIESRTTEEWIDEGSVRAEAAAATRRAGGGDRGRPAPELDPEVAAEIQAALSPERAKRLTERLASASSALDRERFEEALRMVTPLAKELPHVAAVHEVSGLASYRLGQWKKAAQSLELARQLHPDPALLPVLADCYRAMRRWHDVDEVWAELKAASPNHEVMAEGRIVAASAQAEQGDLKGAIAMMGAVSQPPKRVRDHHLRQWYVLADLYDRAGDTVSASRWFREVARHDVQFADVGDRLRALGR